MWISWMLFSLRGRIRRRDWWVGQLALAVLGTIAVSAMTARAGGGPLDELAPSPSVIGLSLLMLWPTIALAVKREHDRDRSGWMPLALLAGGAAYSLTPVLPAWIEWTAAALQLAGFVYLFVTLGVLDGTPGDNRFGPSPKRFDPPEL